MSAVTLRPAAGTLARPLHVYASTAAVLEAHRFRFAAGVPGCSCGEDFPEDPARLPVHLHDAHLAPLLACHVLRAAISAIRATAGAGADASVSAVTGMVRIENTPDTQKAALT